MRDLVLIVDDDKGMRTLLREFVEQEGFRVRESHDGVDGIEAYRQLQPSIVLMDLQMPLVNGIEATARICQEYPDAFIVVVTVYDDEGLREIAAKAGAYGYVLKDDLPVLRTLLRERRETGASLRAP